MVQMFYIFKQNRSMFTQNAEIADSRTAKQNYVQKTGKIKNNANGKEE